MMAATQDRHDSGVPVSRVDALYIVDVKIIKGIDLMAGDKNGTSDPYTLTVRNHTKIRERF